MRPWLLRPAVLRTALVRRFTGLFSVISSNVADSRNRMPHERALYFFSAIFFGLPYASSMRSPALTVTIAFFQVGSATARRVPRTYLMPPFMLAVRTLST